LASDPGQARWTPQPKPVRGARVRVQASGATAVTNRRGKVTLVIPPGANHTIEVEPAASELSPGVAGPSHGSGGFQRAPSYLFRPFRIIVSVDAAGFAPIPAPRIELQAVAGAPPHALVFAVSPSELVIDWKPDWLKSGNRNTVDSKRNEFLVIHRTGSDSIGSAINTFTNPRNVTGIQYIVDIDGHALKLVHELDKVNHAGAAFWQGVTQINARSVGIEVVHGGNGNFADAQYATVLRLVREIRGAHASITRQGVVAHADIAVESGTNRTISTRRVDDPGETFDWARLENAGLVRRRSAGPPPPTVYGIGPGEFVSRRRPTTRNGSTPSYGELQRDLLAVGYSIAENGTNVSGSFDRALERAIQAFQRRYFSGSARAVRGANFVLGQLDFDTAFAVKMVAGDTSP
jgi:N-acetylmuramoyl-L-alanine amidase